MDYLTVEANVQIEKDCKQIAKYLNKCNLGKQEIPIYSFVSNSVKRKVSFDMMDYFKMIPDNFIINEPFGYFEFRYNEGKTHAKLVDYKQVFRYVLIEEKLKKELITDNMITLTNKDQLIIIAYVEKERTDINDSENKESG